MTENSSTNPWLALDTTRSPFVLDIDRHAVETHNQRNAAKPQYQFHTADMLPEPFLGALSAPVIVLTGNPRFRDDDLETHRRSDVREHLSAMLRQQPLGYPLVWLDPALSDTTGARWYRSRLRELIEACGVGKRRTTWLSTSHCRITLASWARCGPPFRPRSTRTRKCVRHCVKRGS